MDADCRIHACKKNAQVAMQEFLIPVAKVQCNDYIKVIKSPAEGSVS